MMTLDYISAIDENIYRNLYKATKPVLAVPLEAPILTLGYDNASTEGTGTGKG